MLNDNQKTGILACGYLQKSTRSGSIHNLTRMTYDGVWVISGTGTYEDAQHGVIDVGPGDFIQRSPGVTHSTVVTSDDYAELYIVVGSDIYHLLDSMDVLSKEPPVLSPGLDFKLLESFRLFLENLSSAEHIDLPLLVPSAIDIIIQAHYLHRQRCLSSAESNALESARRYMSANLHMRLSVEDVAAYANMGYEKFRKLFTKSYGISPSRFMQQARINQAQQMLSNKEAAVKDIALRLGYTDSYTFSKQFKQFTGLAPQRFREMFL